MLFSARRSILGTRVCNAGIRSTYSDKVCYTLGTTRPLADKRAFQEYEDSVAKIEKQLQAHLEERRSGAETIASANEAAREEKGRLEESRLMVGADEQQYYIVWPVESFVDGL